MKTANTMWSWMVVVLVGVIVVAVVVGLSLFPRLSAAQHVLDSGKPAFDKQRVAGDRASITMISHIVDTVDPVATPQGGEAAEVPQLVAFVAQKSGLPPAAVLAALQKDFPHTTALVRRRDAGAVPQIRRLTPSSTTPLRGGDRVWPDVCPRASGHTPFVTPTIFTTLPPAVVKIVGVGKGRWGTSGYPDNLHGCSLWTGAGGTGLGDLRSCTDGVVWDYGWGLAVQR